jgi:hypothetical protein
MEQFNDHIMEFLELYERKPSTWNTTGNPRHKNQNHLQGIGVKH